MAEAERVTTEVLVAGAGPAGLLLARELQIAGVATMLIDKLPERSGICRGFTLNARSLDILARRNMLGPFLASGWKVPRAAFSGLPVVLMLEGAATDHPYTLGIGQDVVERLLEAEAVHAGVCIRWGHELVSLEQDDGGVTAVVRAEGGMQRVRAHYLAGCDGSRSVVRKQAGIDFPGVAAKRMTLLGDVELADTECLAMGINRGTGGTVFVLPRPGYVRILVRDPRPPGERERPVQLEEFAAAVSAVAGKEVVLRNPRWLTRFGDAARQAERYVAGRVVLAGDAAHIHPPAGAIGVNVALDDAFNLGWKLAATVKGNAPEHLLETYHAERHVVGKRVLESTRAQVLLGEETEEWKPLREFLMRLFRRQDANVALAEMVTCLDTRYEGSGQTNAHPWMGCMVPDLELRVTGEDEDTCLAKLLSDSHGVLMDATEDARFLRAVGRGAPNVLAIHATTFSKRAPAAMLVRPDGHAAWIAGEGGGGTDGLREAMTYWFGRVAANKPGEWHAS